MACEELLSGIDLRCIRTSRKFEQRVVFINRADIDSSNISATSINNRAVFSLKARRSGKEVNGIELGNEIKGSFSMAYERSIPMYTHSISIPVIGVRNDVLNFLKQIDRSDVCAVIRFGSGEILIFGLDYGLKTNPYSYEPQSSSGGSTIELQSRYSEYNPPYIYSGSDEDFDNNFEEGGIEGSFDGSFDNSFEVGV